MTDVGLIMLLKWTIRCMLKQWRLIQ